MLDLFLTVDVEIWCDGWHDLDDRFPAAFRKYLHGPTPQGRFGLPRQIEILNRHGLTGVFFVEPLFAARFGLAPLAEVVAMLQAGGQEIQLHLHTEWADEARPPLTPARPGKRRHLRLFDLEEQIRLIDTGARLLWEAGAEPVQAFRAGNFGFNRDTLRALAALGIPFDSSYNANLFGLDSGVLPGVVAADPFRCDGVCEYPMTVFRDGTGALRHAQLTACSWRELEALLWRALESDKPAFVLLWHNFELLNAARNAPDPVVIRRFEALCAFLERNRDCFRVRGFRGLEPCPEEREQSALLRSPLRLTAGRLLEQAFRRIYR